MDDIQFSEFLDESIPLWRNDPVMFFREVLNFEPDEWQAEAARDLAANPKVSIKSGQGVGKTGLEAAVFLWFITCFPYPRIVATAPTKQQLHDVLWSEISKWMSKSELLSMLLKWTKTITGADIAGKRGDEDERVWTDWTETLGRTVL